MRWWLLIVLAAAASLEGFVLTNWPVGGVKLPLLWLSLFLLVAERWAGWRQCLAMTAIAGYWLDVLAAPVAGSILLPLIMAVIAANVIMLKGDYSRLSKVVAFVAGSLVYLSSSLQPGPYLPSWTEAILSISTYLLVVTGAYGVLKMATKNWPRRI